jgi:hypothetical protein
MHTKSSKWILFAGLALLLLTIAALANAETVTVRLDFSRFNQAELQTPLTGKNYYDFELVDADTSIMRFQEFILKDKFPELRNYGTSAETVLAYTDANGLLYDGVEDVVGLIADRANQNTVILYLWEGMRYLQWMQGGRPVLETDSFVYNLLPENVHPDAPTADPEQNDLPFGNVIGTDMVLNQVYLDRETVYLSVRKGDLPILFTQSIENAPSGNGLRLTLTVQQKERGLRLHYNREALEKLKALSFSEVRLVIEEQEQIFEIEKL